jgi:predicted DNA-binding transcriptional regulator YafY
MLNAGWNKSERTIQRTLNELASEFGILRDERSKPFGYRWHPDAKGFSVAELSHQESLMLRLSEEYLEGLLPPQLLKSMKGFFEHSRNRLLDPTDKAAALEKQWLKKVLMISERQPLIPPDIDADVFETITEALYQNRVIALAYENAGGKVSEIEVLPLGLVQQGCRFYIVCRYRDSDKEYSLAVHRIKSAKSTIFQFDPPAEFDLRQYADDGRLSFGTGVKVKATFVVDKKVGLHLNETPLAHDQEITDQQDGTIKVTATVVDSILLDKFVYSFGKSLKSYEKSSILENE